MSSRFSPSDSLKAPFRTVRSRPGRQSQLSSPARIAGIHHHLLEEGPQTPIGFARQHRRTSSAPANTSQPVATPKPRRALPWYADRAETESRADSYSRAPSPAIAASIISTRPPPVSFRQSLQSLARAGSFSLHRTPKGRSSTGTKELYTTDDEADNSDGSRFDLLSEDPFRSDSPIPFRCESPIAVIDIEDLPPPPVPPKPLHIIPPCQLIALEESFSTPTLDTTPTPTSPVAAMRSAFNRMTNSTGKSRIRLLSFIKEVKSPVTADDEECDSRAPPRLNLPDLNPGEPLFDASAFQLPEIPLPKKKIRVEGPSLGQAAPPPAPTSRPAPPMALGTLPGPSALQLHLHGDGDFEGYVIASPVESFRVPTPPIPPPAPLPPPVVSPSSREPPAWIKKFREELEELAGEALNLTSFPDRLVLELPQEPGENRRRTLVFQEESTPELTYDSVSVSSFGKTPRPPTRPVPPIPMPPSPPVAGGDIDYSTWTPRDLRASLYTIKSNSTWDPDQPIPSIPDQDSSYLTSDDEDDDDLTIRAAARPQPHLFQPAFSKQQAIEEAIRKIQRKAEVERISVIQEEEEEESSSEPPSEPPSPVADKAPVPALFRHASNPFALPFESSNKPSRSNTEQPKQRKVSLLRKRVLSKSTSSTSTSAAAHSRSFSEPVASHPDHEAKRIVVAGRLPLNNRSTTSDQGHGRERALPSLPPPPPVSAKPQTPVSAQPPRDYFGHPVYLTASTPTFEVVPHNPFRTNDPPAVYYPVDATPLSYPKQRSSDFFVEL